LLLNELHKLQLHMSKIATQRDFLFVIYMETSNQQNVFRFFAENLSSIRMLQLSPSRTLFSLLPFTKRQRSSNEFQREVANN